MRNSTEEYQSTVERNIPVPGSRIKMLVKGFDVHSIDASVTFLIIVLKVRPFLSFYFRLEFFQI